MNLLMGNKKDTHFPPYYTLNVVLLKRNSDWAPAAEIAHWWTWAMIMNLLPWEGTDVIPVVTTESSPMQCCTFSSEDLDSQSWKFRYQVEGSPSQVASQQNFLSLPPWLRMKYEVHSGHTMKNFRTLGASPFLPTSKYILHLFQSQAISSNCILVSRFNEKWTIVSNGERKFKLACWSTIEHSLYLWNIRTTFTSSEVSILCCQSAQIALEHQTRGFAAMDPHVGLSSGYRSPFYDT